MLSIEVDTCSKIPKSNCNGGTITWDEMLTDEKGWWSCGRWRMWAHSWMKSFRKAFVVIPSLFLFLPNPLPISTRALTSTPSASVYLRIFYFIFILIVMSYSHMTSFSFTPFICFIPMKGHVVVFRHLSVCSSLRCKSLTILLYYCPFTHT